MKRIIYTLILNTMMLLSHSQSLTPTVISSTGAYASNANNSLSYTVGEMTMVQTFSANNNILTQGFQQPQDNVTGLIDLAHDEFGTLIAYPNPAVNYIWYGFQFPENGKVSISLTNALGQTLKTIEENSISGDKVIRPISLSEYAAGFYLISANFVSNNDHQSHTITKKFEIIP